MEERGEEREKLKGEGTSSVSIDRPLSSGEGGPSSKYPSALKFEVTASWGRARVAKLHLPHFTCDTPMFMPVGTQGTVKGITCTQLEELDCHLILGNTYHLGNRPGGDLLELMGGLHIFMNWKRAMLTDSGGFQMVYPTKSCCSPRGYIPILIVL